jgi:hypothetical protein
MEMKKCINHENQNPNFFCFDDKKFLCDSCFKEHRKHNIQIISEIKKCEKIYKKSFTNKSFIDSLKEIKNILDEIKNKVETKLNIINKMLSSLNNSCPTPGSNSIFNLNYQEYEKIEEISKIFESMEDISKQIKKLKNYNIKNEYTNFREINKEVNIIENSIVHSSELNLDVMLGKEFGSYSLFEGSNNHYAIFDFQKKLYLKDILISVKQGYGCVLKNFKVSIKNEYGNWEEINSFICQDNNYKDEIQSFPIEEETQFVKIDFIDSWSNDGGNYILIKKLSFRVADII